MVVVTVEVEFGRKFDRLVDEDLIVLRKIIHEMKKVERNYEPLEDWME